MKLSLHELVQGVTGDICGAQTDCSIAGISIDTRTLKPGECYVAIRGASLDGHTFLAQAKEKGASAYVVDEAGYRVLQTEADTDIRSAMSNLIVVPDTTVGLGKIAACVRKQFNGPSIGITGSCGKTTTKELVASVMQKKFHTLANTKNLNNQFGVPLTLLALDDTHQALVCEMGASQVGDIRYLSNLVKPHVGIITNVQPVHLDGFGCLEYVYRTKLELAEYLDTMNGTVILNGDDEKLVREARAFFNVNLVTVGRDPKCDFSVTRWWYDEGTIHFIVNGTQKFQINTIAPFNVWNALPVLALADHYGIDGDAVREVFASFTEVDGRFCLYEGKVFIIDDTYNANPHAFAEVLRLYKKMKISGRKVVVCGDMLELGTESVCYHEELAKHIVDAGATIVIGMGKEIHATIKAITSLRKGIHCCHFDTNEAAAAYLIDELQKGDAVLAKGSRGLQLDEIVRALVAVNG